MNTKSLPIRLIVSGLVAGFVIVGALALPGNILAADTSKTKENAEPKFCIEPVAKTIKMIVTAYSSSWDETTGIPGKPGLITASGKEVEDGIVATNSLPFGTKIRLPEIYGNKVFVVEDRMHPRKKGMIDLWKSSKKEAKEFGAKYNVTVEILREI